MSSKYENMARGGKGPVISGNEPEKGHQTVRKGTDDNYMISGLLPSKPGIVLFYQKISLTKLED